MIVKDEKLENGEAERRMVFENGGCRWRMRYTN